MTDAPILVTGALGNVGGATVTALLHRGERVRAADLDTDALAQRFPDAEAVRLDFLDPTTFEPALAGCRALFLLRPPPISRVKPTLNRLIDVAAQRGLVEHVVFSSVEGADTNTIVPHHRVETHLRASALPWTILRPGFFAQNLTDAYRLDIRDDHRLYVPAAHGRVAFIDVADLGKVAATVFTDPTPHTGQGYTLTGPEALTFDQVADLLTRHTDPLPTRHYRRQPAPPAPARPPTRHDRRANHPARRPTPRRRRNRRTHHSAAPRPPRHPPRRLHRHPHRPLALSREGGRARNVVRRTLTGGAPQGLGGVRHAGVAPLLLAQDPLMAGIGPTLAAPLRSARARRR